MAKLQEQQLDLTEPASKQQLIRRATFDLTGLPPDWQDVQNYLNDKSPDAFKKVVNRLLDSPAYGEHWGRHWLDLARYADTHGGAAIGFKKFAFSYTYRDYVIRSFNEHVPFDQFIVEQLAADQLGHRENARLAALGFLTVGMQFRNPHNIIDDQIDVVTRGLMGLTVSCARCHDHKFDAITIQDYYSLYSVFASSTRPEEYPIIGKPEKTKEYAEYQQELDRLKTAYRDMSRDQTEIMRGRLRMQVGLYLREIAKGAPSPDLVAADVFSYRTDDLRPHVLHRWQQYLNKMSEDDAVFGPWVQLSRMNATNEGTEVSEADGAGKAGESDAEDFSTKCKALVESLRKQNGELSTGLHKLGSKAPRWNPRVLTALELKQPSSMLEVADAMGGLFASVHREWLQAQLDASLEAVPGATPIPDEDPKHLAINSPVNRQLRRHLYDQGTPTNLEERLASRQLNRPINDNLNGKRGAIHSLNLSAKGSPPRAMVLEEMPEAGPFHVFLRGDPLKRGDIVQSRFLSALGGSDQQAFAPGKRRLELARAIVAERNPLTRRVIVNWVWLHHFGQGIVRTPDDFGTRGEPPTHPKLLDYLATKFHQEGWSLRKLHERIMLSRTYQQASVERPAARKVDPENSLIWRMPRRRLGFEAMRDSMLLASGELGAPRTKVMGAAPFDLLSTPVVRRRSVYAFVNRDIVNPLMSTFDTANPNACTAKRPKTTVPQQTLFALNSEFIQDRADALATLASTPGQTDASPSHVVRIMYRRAFGREPKAKEIETAIDFVSSRSDRKVGWQQLAHALLASNEFMFLD